MKRNSYLEGFKFAVGFSLFFLIIGIVSAVGFHSASEIIPGTFSGEFTFVNRVNIGANQWFYSTPNGGGNYGQIKLHDSTTGDMIFEKYPSGEFIFLNGEIGVGTVNPSHSLVINSSDNNIAKFQNGNAQLIIQNGNTGVADVIAINAAGNGNADLNFGSWTLASTMRITSSGNIGIGNTTPISKLQIGTPVDGAVEFIQIDAEPNNPIGTDCDVESESGRMYLDFDDHRLYICNRNRNWDYITLTD